MASRLQYHSSEAPIFVSILFDRIFRVSLLSFVNILLQWVVLLMFVVYLASRMFDLGYESILLPSTFFVFSFWAVTFMLSMFGEYLKHPKGRDPDNVATYFSFEVANAVLKAEKEGEMTSSTLLYHLLITSETWRNLLSRAMFPLDDLLDVLNREKEGSENIIEEAFEVMKERGGDTLRAGDVMVVMSKKQPVFERFLTRADLSHEDIKVMEVWLQGLEKRKRMFWEKEELLKYGSLGRDWSSGYANQLERYSRDITAESVSSGLAMPVGHDKQLVDLERMLSREGSSSVLLIGEHGVRKRDILLGLAAKCLEGVTFDDLNYRKVVELDMTSFLSHVSDLGEREAVLDKIFNEVVNAGNIILVLDDVHQYMEGEDHAGSTDVSGILSKYLRMPQFHFIGVTEYTGLHEHIESNRGVASLFSKVEVPELTKEDTLSYLLTLVPDLEKRHRVSISYVALRDVVSLSDQYVVDVPFPQKAESLLDESLTYLAQQGEDILLPKHVQGVLSSSTEVPVGELQEEEKQKLLNLENLMHERLVGQDEAVTQVASALRRSRSKVDHGGRPMGTFLFLGPTGVGKTETAKAISDIYFGSEKKMIRLDMSEFQSVDDIPRLLGEKGREGMLTTPVREDPFSLVLLDELEKAHKNILNLFLQVLDEGHLSDGSGHKVDFRNTIIIATSNAGYKLIMEGIRQGRDLGDLKQDVLQHLFDEGIYRPEFINRFNAVVLFKPLSEDETTEVARMMLRSIKEDVKEQRGVDLMVTDELAESLSTLGHDDTFGARNMRRVIENKIEDALARAILEDAVVRGDRIKIEPDSFKVVRVVE